jgi:hypothetical protein
VKHEPVKNVWNLPPTTVTAWKQDDLPWCISRLDVWNVCQSQRKPEEKTMRYAARVDQNQDQVVSALRAAGAYVWIIGLPVDLLVGFSDKTYLVEIKSGPKKRLTDLQDVFFKKWIGGELHRIDGPEDALRMIGVI